MVGQAGPYYVTGQQLLVRKDDDSINGPDDLSGKKVCSVTGSTSIANVEEQYGATAGAVRDAYSECVQNLLNSQVDAVTTDGAILLGYAAQDPDKLKVVGDPFSEERYGIGFKKDDTAMCEFLNHHAEEAFDDGAWKAATRRRWASPATRTAPVDRTARRPRDRRAGRLHTAAGPSMTSEPGGDERMGVLLDNLPTVLRGFVETLELLGVSR